MSTQQYEVGFVGGPSDGLATILERCRSIQSQLLLPKKPLTETGLQFDGSSLTSQFISLYVLTHGYGCNQHVRLIYRFAGYRLPSYEHHRRRWRCRIAVRLDAWWVRFNRWMLASVDYPLNMRRIAASEAARISSPRPPRD